MRALLSLARFDLMSAKARHDPHALRVSSIGIASSYRSIETDFSAWKSTFATNWVHKFPESKKGPVPPEKLDDKSARSYAVTMTNDKAIPGFSNHTQGQAVDFKTSEGKTDFGPSGSQREAWKDTWLFGWLCKNAGKLDFAPYEKEPWHWDYHAQTPEQYREAWAPHPNYTPDVQRGSTFPLHKPR
jgi:hypothetical protein